MAKKFPPRQYFDHNSTQLVMSGKEYFDLSYQLLNEAREEVHFQTYIFEEDETGKKMADALIQTAQRGVRVYLLADAYGSQRMSDETKTRMRQAGIVVRLFGPLLSKGRIHFGRRLHQKIILVDRRKALIGGINISNNYSGLRGKEWLDFGVLVEGNIIPTLVNITLNTWLGFSMQNLRRKWRHEQRAEMIVRPDQTVRVKALENDGLRGKYQCAASYLELINSAKDTITLVGGYFLPGGRGRRALKRAVRRGVTVRVVLPAKSDVGLMHRGMLFLYDWLLRNRIAIMEYLPANVHGKALVVDRKKVSIGSYDLNNLSTYSNIELNLEIDNVPFAQHLDDKIDAIIRNQCQPVTLIDLEKRFTLTQRFVNWLSYRMVKIMFILAVWLATTENE